jgi:hypothetical protein
LTAHPAPGASPISRDYYWYAILALIGVILGSVATFGFRDGFFRNIVIGGFLALGVGLVLDAANVTLPFEPWLKSLVHTSVDAIAQFFAQLVRN